MAQSVEHIVHIMGQTKEASPRGGVPKASDLSLLARKGVEVPLQGTSTTIERTERWFESNCHHHSEALVDQGLPLFLSPGITAEGFTFFRVHLGDVNGSGRHSVHTVVWLSCRKIGVASLVESAGFVVRIMEKGHHQSAVQIMPLTLINFGSTFYHMLDN